MRKDILAAGARRATFAGGIGENDALRNAAPEGSFDTTIPDMDVEKTPRKKFIPADGVLLVRRMEAQVFKRIVTDTMEKEQPAEGIILERGSGANYLVGSHIVFGKYSGAEFKLNGETLLLMDAKEVKGSLVDEKPKTKIGKVVNT